jgi:2'-5' RNA ligase superfamily
MSLLVITYPQLSPKDYAWIQSLRSQNDPQYGLVEPHITLVFPTADISQTDLVDHVIAQTTAVGCIDFSIHCAMPVKESVGFDTHLFLVPDQGFSQIVKLHDTLYTGPLASSLRLDIPYIPHITIGAHRDPWVCKVAADQLNQQDIAIHGTLTALDIIHGSLPVTSSLARIPLKKQT